MSSLVILDFYIFIFWEPKGNVFIVFKKLKQNSFRMMKSAYLSAHNLLLKTKLKIREREREREKSFHL